MYHIYHTLVSSETFQLCTNINTAERLLFSANQHALQILGIGTRRCLRRKFSAPKRMKNYQVNILKERTLSHVLTRHRWTMITMPPQLTAPRRKATVTHQEELRALLRSTEIAGCNLRQGVCRRWMRQVKEEPLQSVLAENFSNYPPHQIVNKTKSNKILLCPSESPGLLGLRKS